MDRRTFLALLAAPVAADVLASCGSESSTRGASPDTVAGNTPRAAATADAAPAVTTVNTFGDDLFARLLATDPQANVVCSPISIAIALAMTSAGARGTTLTEMNTVLHVTDQAALHPSMNSLLTTLATANRVGRPQTDGEAAPEVQLQLTDSLWGQTGYQFVPAFLDVLAAQYGAAMHRVDYAADPDAAASRINQWVRDQTAGRIPQLLQPGVVTSSTTLSLINAIHLKARWFTQFDPLATRTAPFTTAAGTVVDVDMMYLDDGQAYAEGDGWQAVELQYVLGDLSFVAVLHEAASPPAADEVFAALGGRQVTLSMPSFDFGSTTDLKDVLIDMGMPTAFDNADFSGMANPTSMLIGHVIHQADITVDEHGTEAAAATAVVMETTAGFLEGPVTLVLDRPFTFFIRHRATSAVLFSGRVTDPTTGR